MADSINRDEWLAELARLGEQAADCDGYLTVREICEQTGRGKDWVRDKLRLAQTAERLEIKRMPSVDLCGRSTAKIVYRVKASDGKA